MDIISFSYNWNNKLSNDAFTTIRLLQPEKYVVGQAYCVTLKKDKLFDVVIVDIRPFFLKNINDFIAFLDTGYDKEQATSVIMKMYPKVDLEKRQLSLILLRKIKTTT